MLTLRYDPRFIRHYWLMRCNVALFITLLAGLTLFLVRAVIFASIEKFYGFLALIIASCAVLCWLYLRASQRAKTLSIDDSGILQVSGQGLLGTVQRQNCHNLYAVRDITRLGRRHLRLNFSYQGFRVFFPTQFAEENALDRIKAAVARYPLAAQLHLPFPWVGITFAAVCSANYFLIENLSSTTGLFGLIAQGGWVAQLVRGGEYYRCLSYGFLHGSFLHLYANVFALVLLSFGVEHVLGRARFSLLLGLGMVMSSLGGFFSSSIIIIGASGGIYALLGAYFWLRLFRAGDYKERFGYHRLAPMVMLLVLDLSVGLMAVNIVLGVHLIGFAFGFLVMPLLYPVIPGPARRPRGRRPVALGTALLLAALGWSLWATYTWGPREDYRVAAQWLTQTDATKAQIHAAAWIIAINPFSTHRDQHEAIRRLADADSLKVPDVRDTLASLYARTGDFSEAISIENRLIDHHYKQFYVNQLARFQLGALHFSRNNRQRNRHNAEHRLSLAASSIPEDVSATPAEPMIADLICSQQKPLQIFLRRQIQTLQDIAELCVGQAQLLQTYPPGNPSTSNLRVVLNPDYLNIPVYRPNNRSL